MKKLPSIQDPGKMPDSVRVRLDGGLGHRHRTELGVI